MKMSNFSFSDYDCIGFDLDMTLARYKLTNFNEVIYSALSNYLVIEKNYEAEFLLKPVDLNFITRGLIADDENGNLMKISPDGTILQATHGTKWLSQEEILEYYYGGHCLWTDLFVAAPAVNANVHFKLLGDFLSLPVALAFARAVDSIDQGQGVQKNYRVLQDIASGMNSILFGKDLCQNDLGIFPQLKKNPDFIYHRCSERLINWLQELKKNGKKLFLITGAYIDHASWTAEITLGKNWKDMFDIIISNPEKITYFTTDRNFLELEGFKKTRVVAAENLKQGEMYMYGNSTGLKTFLSKISGNSSPKILYIGDNIVQDVYAANVYSKMDTISICEELEAEKVFGFTDADHPDQKFILSTLWGSFFPSKVLKDETIWFHLIKNYAKLCVPSVEYLAKFSTDHKFKTFNL